MPEFNPAPSDQITIGRDTYRVLPHPMVPAFAFGQEGRKAFVFQLGHTSRRRLHALKKFKEVFRYPELADICRALAQFAHLPGMGVCRRECLTGPEYDDPLREFPDLEYAVLMPWMNGSTWYDLVVNRTPIDPESSLQIAWKTSLVLAGLEAAGLAHCDIAAPNVIIDMDGGEVHLVDVEDIYAPGMLPPQAVPAGTEGYNHLTAAAGLWSPSADRFAGAVLQAEMLAWHNPAVRDQADEEHFFASDQMQQDSEVYRLLVDMLYDTSPALAELFEVAWFSPTLDDCPPLEAWADVLDPLARPSPVKEWVPLTALPGPAAPHPGNWDQPDQPSEPTHPPVPTLSAPSAPGGPLIGFRPIDTSSLPELTPAAKGGAAPIEPQPEVAPEETRPLDLPDDGGPEFEGQSDLSPLLIAPPDPPHLSVSQPDGDGSYVLIWEVVAEATHYLLQESTTMDFSGGKQSTVRGATQWRVGQRTPATYYYRLRAYTDEDFSEWSNIVFVKLTAA